MVDMYNIADTMSHNVARTISVAIKNNHTDIIESLSKYSTRKVFYYLMRIGGLTDITVFNFIKERTNIIDVLIDVAERFNFLHYNIIYDYIMNLDEIPDELMYSIIQEMDRNETRTLDVIQKFKLKRSIFERLHNSMLLAADETMQITSAIWTEYVVEG